MSSCPDADDAAVGNLLLLLLFSAQSFDTGVDATSGELKAELLGAARRE